MSCLLGGRRALCGTSRKMSSNLKSSNPINQPLNEGSCQPSVPFTILWVSSVQLPSVLKAKRIIQRLWILQLAWDDPVSEYELAHWERWKSELCALTQVQIPRCHFQLHGRKSLFTSSQTRQMRVMACAPICGSSMKIVLFSAPS